MRVQTGWIGPKVCEVTLDNVEVPPSGVLGTAGGAWPVIESTMDKAAAVLSVYMAGGTQKVHEMALEYSQTRIAFGVPIGTFQRVQDHVIDALTEADAAKWSSYEAPVPTGRRSQRSPGKHFHGQSHRKRRVCQGVRRLAHGPRGHRHRPGLRSDPVHQAGPYPPALPRRRPIPQGPHGPAAAGIAANGLARSRLASRSPPALEQQFF